MEPGMQVVVNGLELELREIIGYGIDGEYLIENWNAIVINQDFRKVTYEHAIKI